MQSASISPFTAVVHGIIYGKGKRQPDSSVTVTLTEQPCKLLYTYTVLLVIFVVVLNK